MDELSKFRSFEDFTHFINNSSEQQLTSRSYVRQHLTGVKWSEQNHSITVEKVSQQKCIIFEQINKIEYRHGSITYDKLSEYLRNRIQLFRELSNQQVSSSISKEQSESYEKQLTSVKLSENTIYELLIDFGIDSERVRVYDTYITLNYTDWQIRIGTSLTVQNNQIDISNSECVQFIHDLSRLHRYDLQCLYDEIEQHARLSIQLHRFRTLHTIERDIDTSFISEQFVTLVNTNLDVAKPITYKLSDTMSMSMTKHSNRKYVISIVHSQFGTVYKKTFTKIAANLVDIIATISEIYKTFKA